MQGEGKLVLAPGGRMAAMVVASPADVACLLASVVHGSRRVRFIQPPATELLAGLARYVGAKSVVPVIEAVFPLGPHAGRWRRAEGLPSVSSRSREFSRCWQRRPGRHCPAARASAARSLEFPPDAGDGGDVLVVERVGEVLVDGFLEGPADLGSVTTPFVGEAD